MKFYNRLIPTSKSSSVSMQRLDSDFTIDDKNELDAEMPTRSFNRENPVVKAKEMVSRVTGNNKIVFCVFATVCTTVLTVFFLGIMYFLVPWRVIFIGPTDVITYSPPAVKTEDYRTNADMNFKAKLNLDLANWNSTLDDPTSGAGQICIETQTELLKACPRGLSSCATADINLQMYTLADKLLRYSFLGEKPAWANGMTSNRVLQISSAFLKNNSVVSSVIIVNFKFESKALQVVLSKSIASEDRVGLDTIQEDLTNLLTPACKWLPFTIVKVSDTNTQIDVDKEDSMPHGAHSGEMSSGEHVHEHNHQHN